MLAELGHHYHDFISVISRIAAVYLVEARFDDALTLLNADVLALVKMDSESIDWTRL
jgi:hypothetical protein